MGFILHWEDIPKGLEQVALEGISQILEKHNSQENNLIIKCEYNEADATLDYATSIIREGSVYHIPVPDKNSQKP